MGFNKMLTFTNVQLAGFNKGQLREACRAHGISYAGLNVEAMRTALAEHATQVEQTEAVGTGIVVDGVEQVEQVGTGTFQEALVAAAQDLPSVIVEPRVFVVPAVEVLPLPTLTPALVPAEPKVKRIQKDRPEANGVKRPSEGTICAEIWSWCDGVVADGGKPAAKDLKASKPGLDTTTCTVQFYRWRKFNGISGR